MSGAITGWFIPFTEDEEKIIKDLLNNHGYEETPTGLKILLMGCMEDIPEPQEPKNRPEDDIAKTMNDFINGNPETVRKIASGTVDMLGKIVFGNRK